jgi:hypothetical protein
MRSCYKNPPEDFKKSNQEKRCLGRFATDEPVYQV